MTTAHVLCGLPASGKSTLARSLFPAIRFNLDDIRAMGGFGSGSDNWSRERESVAVTTMLSGAKSAILAGHDVVLDNCHVTPSLPRSYRKELGPLDVEFVVHDLTGVSVNECIRRDAARENGVGEDVIRRLAKSLDESRKGRWKLTAKWLTPDRADPPMPYEPQAGLPPAIIVDIDGTVALHGDKRSPFDYSKVSGDEPNRPVIEAVQSLAADNEIVFVSGREDSCRADTEEWLWRHGLSDGDCPLFMRKTGDHRPDYIVKVELFDTFLRDRYNVRLVLDDRTQVVTRAWRAMGLTCFKVADGDF